MGIYLNPGNRRYQIALNSQIYVDKTEMIHFINSVINTNQRYVSVSRPRRFGKTMAADMLCAYYDRTADSRALFEDRSLAGVPEWDRYLGKFDVIRAVTTDFLEGNGNVKDMLSYMTEEITEELMAAYPDVRYGTRKTIRTVMSRIFESTGRPFVIIIDEWDAIFRIWKEKKEGQKEYLDFLRDWLKDKDYVALAYMTGILPIKKYGKHSALNMFDEYSMISPMQLAPYTAFTDEEVKDLCVRFGRDYEEMKNWYDGYAVSDAVPPDPEYEQLRKKGVSSAARRYSLYSPLSVVNAIRFGVIGNYWNSTETYEALAEYIRRDEYGLRSTVALLMDGGRAKIDLSTYQNDMTTFHSKDDVLALLIHLGYLGYDSDTGEVFIPNKEILAEFTASTKTEEWNGIRNLFWSSIQLLKATWAMDEEKVAALVEKAHDQASNKTYHDETALSYSIQLAYYAAEAYYTKALELDSGKGYADIGYLPAPQYPEKPAMVIELKYNQDAWTAMDQIRQRRYPDRLEHYKGNILLVGINYDKDIPSSQAGYKHHTCTIEKV